MEIVLVRHAEALCNTQKSFSADSELTALGRRQTKLVAKSLSNDNFDFIYSSPLIRTLETASAITEYHNNPIKVYTHLREYRGTENVICTSGENLKRRFPKAIFNEGEFNSANGWTYVGGETKESCQIRAQGVLNYIFENHKENEKILMVSHVGFNVAFISALLGLKPGYFEFSQHNTCVNRFLIEEGKVRVVCLNDHSHLSNIYLKE